MTRRYGKPVFGLDSIAVDGVEHEVLEEIVWSRPFCNLLHFVRPTCPATTRSAEAADRRADVGPLRDAAARHGRGVPADPSRLHHRLDRRAHGAAGASAASISTITSTICARCSQRLGPGVHTLGVCQPAVPLIAAVALMEAADDP